MKNFIPFAALMLLTCSLVFTLCKKEVKGKITAQELKNKYAIVLPDLQYEGDEEPVSKPGEKTTRKKSAESVLVTVSVDLNAEIVGENLVGDVSPNAYHAGGQKFIDTTINDGAKGLWGCNRSYSSPPGAGVTTTCPTEGTGYYRVYSADFVTYDIHLSYFKTVN